MERSQATNRAAQYFAASGGRIGRRRTRMPMTATPAAATSRMRASVGLAEPA